jgi:cell division protein FtsQ
VSQKLKRGGKSVRRAAAAQGKARQVRAARARTGSALDAAMRWVPLSEAQLHRLFLAMILGCAAVLAWMVASFAGVPAMARGQMEAIASDAGFKCCRIALRGTDQLNELKVYNLALADNNRALPFVDIDDVRSRLLKLSWVEDARVSRQLPDTLVVDIVERKPVAVLRKPGRLVLIDRSGIELEPVSAERAKGKLVIAGPGAGKQVEALSALLAAAPALKPQVREAEWVGNRRWNLTFRTGQLLALPQGEQASAKALMTFARLDGVNRLLGGKAVAFDMRASDRIYFRVPGRTDPVEKPVKKESN